MTGPSGFLHMERGAHLESVKSELVYLAADTDRRAPSDWPGESSRQSISIFDARPIAAELSLDVEGFRLVNASSTVRDFYDPLEVRNVYYEEVANLIKRVTGAKHAVTFAHDTRNRARRGENGVREPVAAVHNDYTPVSAPQMVRESVPAAEAERLLEKRFAEFNIWRPIRGPVRKTPLAVCDARSIAPSDLATANLKHEVYTFRYHANHRWYYFPLMNADESLIIKCFDSADDGRARFTAHASFEDPAVPADAPERESIEARVLAFF
jgi:hypothetical protein